jgi:uncharacterized oligopeptide transporter (OPT) family protein
LQNLIPTLQVAVGPVILISGVGLLLLSMTNRLGRAIDRSRQLKEIQRNGAVSDRDRVKGQLDILWRRANLLKVSIVWASASVLLAALLIILLFVGTLMRWDIAGLLVILFCGCLAAVIVSLIYFVRDIILSLHALRLDLDS